MIVLTNRNDPEPYPGAEDRPALAGHSVNTGSDALLGIHHAALICSDYARSKDFYVRILGLRVLAENHRAARDSWKLDLALPDGPAGLFSFPHHHRAPAAPKPRACATSPGGCTGTLHPAPGRAWRRLRTDPRGRIHRSRTFFADRMACRWSWREVG